MSQKLEPNVFVVHDHKLCSKSGMHEARSFCDSEGLRFTPIRARVLEILLESHKALGAYEILDRLKDEGIKGQPPVVYRALDFLVEHGFTHKLERLNAFAACCGHHSQHEPMFLICRDCKQVAETPLASHSVQIDRAAKALGFSVQSRVVEIIGLCPSCQAAEMA